MKDAYENSEYRFLYKGSLKMSFMVFRLPFDWDDG